MAIPYPVISVVIWRWQGFSIFSALNRLWNSTHRINSQVFFKKIEDVSAVRVVMMCLSRLRYLCALALRPARPAVRPLTPAPGVHRLSHLDCTEPHGVSRLPLLSHSPFLHYIMLIRSRTASRRSREILLLQQQHQPCVVCVEEQQHQHCGCIDSAGQPRLKRTPTNTPRSLEQGASTGIDPLINLSLILSRLLYGI